MIYIKRNFAALRIEIEVLGSQVDERFHIPMTLITGNLALNEVYMAFRNLGHGDQNYLRMPITPTTQAAMRHLRAMSCQIQDDIDNQFEHTRNRTYWISRTSVLA